MWKINQTWVWPVSQFVPHPTVFFHHFNSTGRICLQQPTYFSNLLSLLKLGKESSQLFVFCYLCLPSNIRPAFHCFSASRAKGNQLFKVCFVGSVNIAAEIQSKILFRSDGVWLTWVALEILRQAEHVYIIRSPGKAELCGADGLRGNRAVVDAKVWC